MSAAPIGWRKDYNAACQLAESGDVGAARTQFMQLKAGCDEPSIQALLENDLGSLDALEGNWETALHRMSRALKLDPTCDVAKSNLSGLKAAQGMAVCPTSNNPDHRLSALRRTRVAIVSLLFNWPSTGGGTVHTAETACFLSKAGYEVKHLYAQYAPWNLGNVASDYAVDCEPISFRDQEWSRQGIRDQFRAAVNRFAPDWVVITDSWNTKPLLADAVRGYPYLVRLAAQETLCPLNNVRLLVDEAGRAMACPRHQLATPGDCTACVARNGGHSGWLHQVERELAGYGSCEYDDFLRRAYADAEAVLAVNPAIAAQVGPYARSVKVVPSGFDPERFPWPWPSEGRAKGKLQLFFAGLPDEYMKGFHVLRAACEQLWRDRHDFELIVTADQPQQEPLPFTRHIGWQSQADLPRRIREADILVFPTVAEEALGRSAVEAMGVGRPVVASRIGGLPYTVTDEVTGLLFSPGDSNDLAAKLVRLLDSPELRKSLGRAGRKKFEREFVWDVILERHYRPLLGPPQRTWISKK